METPTTEYLYRRYQITMDFLTPIAGGTPLDTGLVASHIARFSEGVSNALKLSKKQDGEVSEEAMNKYMLSVSAGFPLDGAGIYLHGYQVNAMLKAAAQRMKATMKVKGLGNTLRDGGVLVPIKLYLDADPTIVERPVKPANGSATIKIFQVAEGVKLSFPCAVLDNGDLPEDLFQQVWVVAQGVGLGANRHLGYGRFEVKTAREEVDWNIMDLFRNGGSRSGSPVPTASGSIPAAAAGVAD